MIWRIWPILTLLQQCQVWGWVVCALRSHLLQLARGWLGWWCVLSSQSSGCFASATTSRLRKAVTVTQTGRESTEVLLSFCRERIVSHSSRSGLASSISSHPIFWSEALMALLKNMAYFTKFDYLLKVWPHLQLHWPGGSCSAIVGWWRRACTSRILVASRGVPANIFFHKSEQFKGKLQDKSCMSKMLLILKGGKCSISNTQSANHLLHTYWWLRLQIFFCWKWNK